MLYLDDVFRFLGYYNSLVNYMLNSYVLLDDLVELLVYVTCLSLYGSVFNHIVYLRICSFLRGDSAEIFARPKLVISSLNYFW